MKARWNAPGGLLHALGVLLLDLSGFLFHDVGGTVLGGVQKDRGRDAGHDEAP